MRIRVKKVEELGFTEKVSTSLARVYGQAVYHTNKNMNIHRKSQNIENELYLRKSELANRKKVKLAKTNILK